MINKGISVMLIIIINTVISISFPIAYTAVLEPFMRIDRIIYMPSFVLIKPGINAPFIIFGSIIIAEIIMVVFRPDKKAIRKYAEADDK